MKNGNDKQNLGTGLSFILNLENTIEFRTGFIYDFGNYNANYKYDIYLPPPPWGSGYYAHIDTSYVFNIIRVPLTIGLVLLEKKKLHPFFNLGLQLNFAVSNGNVNGIVDYNHQANSAYYFGEGVKYRMKDKIELRAELCQYRFRKVEEEHSRFSYSQHLGLNAQTSLALHIGINYNFVSINPK